MIVRDSTNTAGELLPVTLLDLLSNSLVRHQTAPYLTVTAIHALAATSKSFHALIYHEPDVFRHLDLSTVTSAAIDSSPIDSGGISWRSQRMDEALTEDEFYSGPLLGIFSKLARRHVLRHVSTLILDGLTVTADLVREVIAEDRFNVRILSIRETKHLNERKLMQALRYAVRPSRAEGTPRLRALYVFGPKDPVALEQVLTRETNPTKTQPSTGVMSSQGAQVGAEWNERSQQALSTALSRTEDRWYQSSGRMLRRPPVSEWAETFQACEGLIYFDAVVCRGPRHDPRVTQVEYDEDGNSMARSQYLPPAIATVALGPTGCAKCGSSPEGPAVFGQSPPTHLPLLSPPPLHSSTIRAAQRPKTIDGSAATPLFVRCEGCLRDRWCERCNIWWCESCYSPDKRTELQQQEVMEDVISGLVTKPKEDIKMGSKRDCFGCGRTCAKCKERYIRTCRICKHEYCIVDNEGSTDTACDWCNHSGRRTRELY